MKKMNTNPAYAMPILILSACLDTIGIPHTTDPLFDGYQIKFPWCDGDMICHNYSYGHSIGNVESYCFPWDKGDATELTIKEAFIKIINYYNTKVD